LPVVLKIRVHIDILLRVPLLLLRRKEGSGSLTRKTFPFLIQTNGKYELLSESESEGEMEGGGGEGDAILMLLRISDTSGDNNDIVSQQPSWSWKGDTPY
jgi:hypothetical protein